ncbi:MAG TPA: DUF6600 domain-containing protein [Quisquiliibacterium sp.]|nr:DUF6600 domain-containing protein [Quisquiliibacterium sp.]
MRLANLLRRLLPLLLALLAMAAAGAARADPPLRAARLAFVDGSVSLSTAGDPAWYPAPLNRPLAIGDRVWADEGASAELQLGAAVVRVGTRSDVTVLDFDDRIAQFRLAQGTLRLRVRYLEPGQAYEIATPNLAFTVTGPGDYRVDVDSADDSTLVMVRAGQARVDGETSAYTIHEGRAYRFRGTDLREHAEVAMPPLDGLELWARERDRRAESAAAAAYVSRGVIGYEDLDTWGSWRTDPGYGAVWYPTAVMPGWSPYVFGRWAWIAPWGWTWIDDAPWGFAVTHYGRWAHLGGRWGWVPGPVRARAVYAPALVVFVGGSNFRLSSGFAGGRGVAWFPLGPREVYQPAYQVSRNYFTTINVSNTFVGTRAVHDVYDGRGRAAHSYVNRQVPGAVVAMPENGFARSQPVPQSMVRVRGDELDRGQLTHAPAVAPLRPEPRPDGGAGRAPPPVRERPVIVRNAPPAVDAAQGARPERVDRTTREDSQWRPVERAAPAESQPERVDRAPRVEPQSERPDRPTRPDSQPGAGAPARPEAQPGSGARARPEAQARPPLDGDRDEPRGRAEAPVRSVPQEGYVQPARPSAPQRYEAPAPQAPRFEQPAPQNSPQPAPRSDRSFGAQPRLEQAPQGQPVPQFDARPVPQLQPRPVPQFEPQPVPQFQSRPAPEAIRPPAMPARPMPTLPASPAAPAMRAPQAPSLSPERGIPQAAPRNFEPAPARQAPRQGIERQGRPERGAQQ